jgi:hypothetical protein
MVRFVRTWPCVLTSVRPGPFAQIPFHKSGLADLVGPDHIFSKVRWPPAPLEDLYGPDNGLRGLLLKHHPMGSGTSAVDWWNSHW